MRKSKLTSPTMIEKVDAKRVDQLCLAISGALMDEKASYAEGIAAMIATLGAIYTGDLIAEDQIEPVTQSVSDYLSAFFMPVDGVRH